MASPYKTLVEFASNLEELNDFHEIGEDSTVNYNALRDRIQPVLDACQTIAFQDCEVPVEYKSDFISRHVEDCSHLRNLCRAFRFAADHAAFHADFSTAARYGITILNLANATRRGGLIVDKLLATGISGCGVGSLRLLRNRLDAPLRSELIAALCRYELERESYQEIALRDAQWEVESGYLDDSTEVSKDELIDELIDPDSDLSVEDQRSLIQLFVESSTRPKAEIEETNVNLDRADLARTRLLTIELALHSWKHRTGCYPIAILELAPDILTAVPLDPFTDDDFAYRLAGNTFELYSTGPDKTDSGGRFGPWFAVSSGGYDLCLDAEDYRQEFCSFTAQPGLLRRLWSRLCCW